MPSMASRTVGQVSERHTPAGAKHRGGMTPLKEWNGARPVTPAVPKRASGSRMVSSKFGNVESHSKISRQKQDVSICANPDSAGQAPSVNIDSKGLKPQQVAREPASRGNSISRNFRTPSKPDSHGISVRNSERVSTPAALEKGRKMAVRGQVGHAAASKMSSTHCKDLKKAPQKVVENAQDNGYAAGLSILETASYWLTQIKIAEMESKHETAMVFFRLAVDSAAKPSSELCGALRSYIEKHPQTSDNHKETISLYESLGGTIPNSSKISVGGHTESSATPELSASPHLAESDNAVPVASTQEFLADSIVEAEDGETRIEDTCLPLASSEICADHEKKENELSHEMSEEADTHGSTARKIPSCSQTSPEGRCLNQTDSSVGQLQKGVVHDDSTEGDNTPKTKEDATEPYLDDCESTDNARESALLASDMGHGKQPLAVGLQSVSSLLSTASGRDDAELKAEISCSMTSQEVSVDEAKACNQAHVLYRQAFVTVRDNPEAEVEDDYFENPSLITAQKELVPFNSQQGLRESTIWPEVRGSQERKSTADPSQVIPAQKKGAQLRGKRYAEGGLDLPNTSDSPLHSHVGKATAAKDNKMRKGVHFNDVPEILRTPSPRAGQVRIPVSGRSAAKGTPSLLQTKNTGRGRKSKGTPYKVARESETDSTSQEADIQASGESESHEAFEAVKSTLISSLTQGGASAADSEMAVPPTQVTSIVHPANQTSPTEIGCNTQMDPMVSSFGTGRIMSSHEMKPAGQHLLETLQHVAPEMPDTQTSDEGTEQVTGSQSGQTESSNKNGRRLRRSSSKDKTGTTLPDDATGLTGSIGIVSSETPGSVRRSARLREAATGEIGRTKVVARPTTPATRRSARLRTSQEELDPPTSIQMQPLSPALVTRSGRSRAA